MAQFQAPFIGIGVTLLTPTAVGLAGRAMVDDGFGNLSLTGFFAANAHTHPVADLTDHTKAVHDALGIDAASVGGTTPTAFGKSLIDDANSAAARTTLGLDSDDDVTFGSLSLNSLVVADGGVTLGSTISVQDPIISQAPNNPADALDLGHYAKYVSGGTKYTGLFRDASDGKYKLFTALTVEPTTTVDTGGAGYAVASLVANLEGSVNGITLTTGGSASTFLNGAGGYTTPAGGTPGGSTKQLQFNSAGAFGGAAGFEYQSGASPNVSLTAQATTHTPLKIVGLTNQSVPLLSLNMDATPTGNVFEINSTAAGTGGDKFNIKSNGFLGCNVLDPLAPIHILTPNEGIRVQGSSGVAYFSFYDAAGTRTGYIGDEGVGDNDIGFSADKSDGRIMLYTAGVLRLSVSSAGVVTAPISIVTPLISNGATGIKVGSSATDKVSFWGAAVVVQAAGIVDADGTLADITTKFNALVAKFETYGLLAVA